MLYLKAQNKEEEKCDESILILPTKLAARGNRVDLAILQ